MSATSPPTADESLRALAALTDRRGPELALFLVYDRPDRLAERPGLARTYFAQRCVSDEQLSQMVSTFRSIGAYVELFHGEQPFTQALVDGRIARVERPLKVIYNGIEGSIAHDGFAPGRKALIPALADSYGVVCANSNAYACALGRHKFHYLSLLRSLGLPTPEVWHFRPGLGWAGDRRPADGTHVIAKSTYESWSVGVTEDSVFTVDDTLGERVSRIAHAIGQAVTVHEFVRGTEVCVPVLGAADLLVAPPVEVILAKAPRDPSAVMTIDDNLTDAGVSYRAVTSATLRSSTTDLAKQVYRALELDGLARVDFRVDANGEPHIIDVGVSPGLGSHGSSSASFATLGLSHEQFLLAVVGAALQDSRDARPD